MLKEKIKICFDDSRSDELDLLSLPFISQYRLLSWSGLSDGSLLTREFNIDDLIGKNLVIKSFKIVPYYNGSAVDIWLSDGLNNNIETVPDFARIDRLFDDGALGTIIRLRINEQPIIFQQGVYPLDLDLQNIYFRFAEKITDIDLLVSAQVFQNLQTGAFTTARLKIVMEVYVL